MRPQPIAFWLVSAFVVEVVVPARDALHNGWGQRSRSFGLDQTVPQVVDLGGMEVGATARGFRFCPNKWGRSRGLSGLMRRRIRPMGSHPLENFWIRSCEVVKLLETTADLAMRKVTRSTGIGSANRSALEDGVPIYGQCDVGYSDGRKGWGDGGCSSHVYGWLDGEDDDGEKAAEECGGLGSGML
jgi:hypothetical protein